MADVIASEVAITWAASAGCAFYLLSMLRSGERGVGAQRFLIHMLAALLAVRGFSWLTGDPRLIRLTFAFAAWLPLAITLFFERVMRRHHPLWIKLFALVVSVGFFLSVVIADLPAHRPAMAAFGVCFALVVLLNTIMLLLRRDAGLSVAESRLANLLLLIGLISAPLVLTDFRTLLDLPTMRLGALGALMFVYALLASVVRSLPVAMWLARFAALLVLALILSALIALATQGVDVEAWRAATLHAWPVAFAWMLLTGIVVNRRAISQGGTANAFIDWLAHAPLDSAAQFLRKLSDSPDASTHVVLEAADLTDYRPEILSRLVDDNDGVVSLSLARSRRGGADTALADSAEQWIDLFEKLQMTHGFIAGTNPLRLVLVSLPATTSASAAEARLRVVQHVARRLERDAC